MVTELGHAGSRIHKISSTLSTVIGDGEGGVHSNSTFYFVKLCVIINFSPQHNVLCLSFVVVLYSMYSLYAVIKMVLLDEEVVMCNQLLRSLEWLSIRQLIDYDKASFMYKVANGIVPEQTQFMFDKCTNIHSHNTRSTSSGNYVILKMKTAKGHTAFVFSGAQVWNNLPTHIK